MFNIDCLLQHRIPVSLITVKRMKFVYPQRKVLVLLCTILRERKCPVLNTCVVSKIVITSLVDYILGHFSNILFTVRKTKCLISKHSEVCGENSKTYPSLCSLHKAQVKLAYTGTCRPDHCKEEVCGSDGVTYKSICHARAHSVRIDYYGKCFTEE